MTSQNKLAIRSQLKGQRSQTQQPQKRRKKFLSQLRMKNRKKMRFLTKALRRRSPLRQRRKRKRSRSHFAT
jgi:hypothetical protein